jgi:hypothetical protein
VRLGGWWYWLWIVSSGVFLLVVFNFRTVRESRLLLFLRWAQIISLWNWAANANFAHPRTIRDWIWSSRVMILTGGNWRSRRKAYPSATLFTTNPTWTDPSANAGLRSEKPVTSIVRLLSNGSVLLSTWLWRWTSLRIGTSSWGGG